MAESKDRLAGFRDAPLRGAPQSPGFPISTSRWRGVPRSPIWPLRDTPRAGSSDPTVPDFDAPLRGAPPFPDGAGRAGSNRSRFAIRLSTNLLLFDGAPAYS